MEGSVDKEKLAKLQRMAAGVRVGGKGSVRRKKKAVHKAAPTDDKRLQSTLKRLQLSHLPGIEEVNIFKDNGSVINFKNPKVQAQISANTYVISGSAVTKSLQDMLPSIVNQLGTDNMPQMKSLMDQLGAAGMTGQGLTAAAQAASKGAANTADDDDDIPDLVDNVNFEDKATASAAVVDGDDDDDDDNADDGDVEDDAEEGDADEDEGADEHVVDISTSKDATADAAKDTTADSAKGDTADAAKNATADDAKNATADVAKDAGQDAGKDTTAKETVKVATKESDVKDDSAKQDSKHEGEPSAKPSDG